MNSGMNERILSIMLIVSAGAGESLETTPAYYFVYWDGIIKCYPAKE